MSSIYNSKKCPQILGKLVCYSDWRKYVNVEVDKFGLHYLYVELNKIETKLAKEKGYYALYGWVIYEYPYVHYCYDDVESKIIHDEKTQRDSLPSTMII